MSQHRYPSILLENAVIELSKLPGIGQKTAFRLIMHMLRNGKEQINILANSLKELSDNINYCKRCYSVSDSEICEICSDTSRVQSILCIVENVNDLMAIEKTQQFNGIYHVLGGLISPMEGISPSQLHINELEQRLKTEPINEIIFALSPTVEGDTTAFYIYKKLKNFNVNFTTIAKGIAIGNDLEYTDEITLGRSIIHRIPFEGIVK